MLHFVYKITNLKNNHYYIGVHSTKDIDDGYMGSGRIMRFALKKHGVQSFKREIIYNFGTRKETLQKERELITVTLLNDPNCYNLMPGGGEYNEVIYSKKAEKIEVIPPKPFDSVFEYKIKAIFPIGVKNPEALTSFGKAFWGIITGPIFDIVTSLYNRADGNKLANSYISLLERIPEYKHNIGIYRVRKLN